MPTVLATTPERSKLMSRVRQRGTAPELAVRDILKLQGHTFQINGKMLPGSPDVFDTDQRRVVFVHGCFWHRHAGCRACTSPKSYSEFWQEKFAQNQARDRRNVRQLRHHGYRVLTVWECQVKSPAKLARLKRRLDKFFRRPE